MGRTSICDIHENDILTYEVQRYPCFCDRSKKERDNLKGGQGRAKKRKTNRMILDILLEFYFTCYIPHEIFVRIICFLCS